MKRTKTTIFGLIILGLFASAPSFAQFVHEDEDANTSPDPLTEAIQGRSNGCRDGQISNAAQATNAFYSIMDNPFISMNYKAAYEAGWGICRAERAAGTILTASGMTSESQCFNFGQNCSFGDFYSIANCFGDGQCGAQTQ